MLHMTVDFISFNSGVLLKILEQIIGYGYHHSENEGAFRCDQVLGTIR